MQTADANNPIPWDERRLQQATQEALALGAQSVAALPNAGEPALVILTKSGTQLVVRSHAEWTAAAGVLDQERATGGPEPPAASTATGQ